MIKRTLTALVTAAALGFTGLTSAADYVIDTKGAHAFVQFKISHLGYSWLLGRFNDFSGEFSYDANSPEESEVNVTIQTASVDSNHAERDKHLRSDDFLDVDKYPTASFKSSGFKPTGDGKAVLSGDLTLHGVTRAIEIDVTKIGEGNDPWGGYRVGFEGSTNFALKDFGIMKNLGPASENVEMYLSIEGIRKK